MRRLLLQTSAIQSTGVVLMLATTLLVSRLGGPAAQGSFALVKSFNDLLAAVFSLGLPSAMVIMLNRTGSGHRALFRFTWRYGMVLLIVLPLLTAVLLQTVNMAVPTSLALLQPLLIGWSSAFLTIFAFHRALLLVYDDGPIFSVISVLHWVIIFPCAAILLNRTDLIFEISYFLAGAGSLAIIYPIVRKLVVHEGVSKPEGKIDWPFVRRQSIHVMIQALLYGIQPFITNAALSHVDPALKLVGYFNIAALTITLPNLVVALVAPVLLNRWSKYLDWDGLHSIRNKALLFGLIGQLCTLAAWPLLPWMIRLFFSPAFNASVEPTRILLLATCSVIATRILTPAMQGLGRNDIVSLSCLMRMCTIVLVAAIGFLVLQWPALEAVAAAWCLGEYAALATLLLGSTRKNAVVPRTGSRFMSIGATE